MSGVARDLPRWLGVAALCWAAVVLDARPPVPTVRPDMLLCLFAVCAVWAPRAAPIGLVAAAALTRDFAVGEPPGAGALGVLLAVEALRANGPRLRALGPAAATAAATAACVLAATAPAALPTLTLGPRADAAELALRALTTALAFPVAALALSPGFDRPAPAAKRDA